ncbi:uncharacterized protein LOC144359225, partial [Saccoglossus kowalevskii]
MTAIMQFGTQVQRYIQTRERLLHYMMCFIVGIAVLIFFVDFMYIYEHAGTSKVSYNQNVGPVTLREEPTTLDELSTLEEEDEQEYGQDAKVQMTWLLNKLHDIKERILAFDKQLSLDRDAAGITKAMFQRGLKRRHSMDRMVKILSKVILTNGSLTVGILGGSISAGVGVGTAQGMYVHYLLKYLRKMLDTTVDLQNGAVGATYSTYFLYCARAHLCLEDLDVVFWELADNDFGRITAHVDQERLTREILGDLPRQPQLVYVNFLGADLMRQRSCRNNEQVGSVPLSEHYDVPSISIPDAICPMVQSNRTDSLISTINPGHPSGKVHSMAGVYLAYLFRNTLMTTLFGLYKNLRGTAGRLIPGIQPSLPLPYFKLTEVYHTRCWSSMKSQYTLANRIPERELEPVRNTAWILYTVRRRGAESRTDRKRVWYTTTVFSPLEFIINVKKIKHMTPKLAVATLMPEEDMCGSATISVDGGAVITVDCFTSKYSIVVVHQLGIVLSRGRHSVKISNISVKG